MPPFNFNSKGEVSAVFPVLTTLTGLPSAILADIATSIGSFGSNAFAETFFFGVLLGTYSTIFGWPPLSFSLNVCISLPAPLTTSVREPS